MVAGSNPAAPTTILASNPPRYEKHSTTLLSFVNKSVNKDQLASELFEQLTLLQKHHGLSDRTLAKKLGISNTHLSYLRRGLRKLKPSLIERIIITFPQLKYLLPEGLIFSSPFFASITGGDTMDAKNFELTHLIKDFLVAKQAEGKTDATLAFYGQNLNRILWWLDTNGLAKEVPQITAQDLRSLLVYVQTAHNRWQIGSTSSIKPAGMSTVDAYWRTLQAFFSWLVNEEIIDAKANPMKKIPRPDVPRKIIEDIPLQLVKKATEECGNSHFRAARNRAIILTFVDTGVRLGACAGMDLPDIDPETGLAKVWEKGGQQVIIHLNKTARAALKYYLTIRNHHTNNSLWLKEDGTTLTKSAIQSMIRRLRKCGGNARWTPHTFRNTWAINFLRAGGDTFSLQILGGWKDLDTPRRYTEALKIEDAIRVHCKASPADRMAAIEDA